MYDFFTITNYTNKKTVKLKVLIRYSVSSCDVECCYCDNSVFRIYDYFGTCPKCNREYSGPHLTR